MNQNLINNKIQKIESSVKTFTSAIKPIFRLDDTGNPYHAGTAFSLRVNNTDYLVTAAHALEKNKQYHSDHDDIFYITANNELIEIKNYDKIKPNNIDLVLIELQPEVMRSLFVRTIQINEVLALNQSLDGNHFLSAYGFPASKNKVSSNHKISNNPYAYIGNPLKRELLNQDEHSSPYYFGIDLILKKTYYNDQREIKAPKPHGISGGPVFVIYDVNKTNDTYLPKLCGVVIEKEKGNRGLICIDIRAIISQLIKPNLDL